MAPETRTPDQTRDRLAKRLVASLPNKLKWLSWYYGMQAPPVVAKKYAKAYSLIQGMATNPWAGLVVDALNQRIKAEGFVAGDDDLNAQLWQTFRANQFDADQRLVYGEALTFGASYISVWPSRNDPKVPILRAETALQITHEPDPENRRRSIAALKMWYDPLDELWYTTLYTSEAIHKWQAEVPTTSTSTSASPPAIAARPDLRFAWITTKDLKDLVWIPRTVDGEEWPAPNPLEAVPIIPVVNRPALHAPEAGISEIGAVESILSRIDKITLDMLLTSEVAAFRQRWATGLEIPEDKDGNPIEPFSAASDRLWISDSTDTSFGTFEASDLGQYLKARNSEIEALAANARIPSFNLVSASLVNPPSAEAMSAAETGLVAKVTDQTDVFSEALEQAMRLTLVITGDDQPDNIGVLWRDPATRNAAQTADAATKMAALQVPIESVWRFLGATPEEITQWKAQQASASALELLLATQATGAAVEGAPIAPDQPPAAPDQPQIAPDQVLV